MRKYKVKLELNMSLTATDAQDAIEKSIQHWLENPSETLRDAVEVEEDWVQPTKEQEDEVEECCKFIEEQIRKLRDIDLGDYAYEVDYGPDEYYGIDNNRYYHLYVNNRDVVCVGDEYDNGHNADYLEYTLSELGNETIVNIAECLREYLEDKEQ